MSRNRSSQCNFIETVLLIVSKWVSEGLDLMGCTVSRRKNYQLSYLDCTKVTLSILRLDYIIFEPLFGLDVPFVVLDFRLRSHGYLGELV